MIRGKDMEGLRLKIDRMVDVIKEVEEKRRMRIIEIMESGEMKV